MNKIALVICMVWIFGISAYPLTMQIVGTDYPPFTQINPKNGKAEGFALDVLYAVLCDLKIDARFNIYPWKRAEAILSEEPDTIAFLARSDARENSFYWVGPVYPRSLYLYRLKSRNDIHLKTISDIGKYKIGVINGYASIPDLLKAGVSRNNLEPVATDAINIKKLFANRIDFIPGNELLMANLLRKEGLSSGDVEKTFVIVPEGKNYYYFGVSRKTDKKNVQRLQLSFDKLVQNGGVRKILQKYLQ